MGAGKKHSLEDFLRWYYNKNNVRTLEDLQKFVEFYHNKRIDILNLGSILSKLAEICLHYNTSAKFSPFAERDKDFFSNAREVMFGGPSKMFTRKAVVNGIHIRKFKNVCKETVGINASQVHTYSMCQLMPAGLY